MRAFARRAVMALCVLSVSCLVSTSTHAQVTSAEAGDCQAGFTADLVCATVPERVPPGHTILVLPFRWCGSASRPRFMVRTPSLRVTSRGELVASHPFALTPGQELHAIVRALSVGEQWSSGTRIVVRRRAEAGEGLSPCPSRARREWQAPVPHITENDPGPYPAFVTKYTSDRNVMYNLRYKLTGPGVDEEPVGLFYLGEEGRVYVRRAVDRERIPVYNLLVHAYNAQGVNVESPANMTVVVNDVNDETPQFTEKTFTGAVLENRPPGALVLRVSATDADEPDTDHVVIVYEIVSQKPPAPRAFAIDRSSGSVTTLVTLDKEAVSKFVLEVRATDCNGSPLGLSNITTVTITVQDTNDNPPTFGSPTYEAIVKENEVVPRAAVLAVRDADEPGTPAWRAVYAIVAGDDTGNFAVATDPQTNFGVLSVVKPIDFEALPAADKTIPVVVTVKNEQELEAGAPAPPTSSTATVFVHVLDAGEDPAFVAPTRVIRCEEGAPIGTQLGAYTARDPDAGASGNLKYSILSDTAGWLAIDPRTGAISVVGHVDRENLDHVQDDKYNVTVIAVDSGPPEVTCTGTVVLMIQDANDHAPRLAGHQLGSEAAVPFLCLGRSDKGLPLVATDADSPEHGPPFDFRLLDEPPGTAEAWEVVTLNATSAQLQERATPSDRGPRPGVHRLSVLVTDRGGLGDVQPVTVRTCHCLSLLDGSGCVTPAGSAGLGSDGAAAIAFPILALALLGILCCYLCRQQRPILKIPDVWGESLVHYNYEGGGSGDEAQLSLDPSPDPEALFNKGDSLSMH